MQGQRQRARAQGGVQDAGAVTPGGVHEQLPGPYGAGSGEPLDQTGQGVVGDGQQHQVGAPEDLGGRHDGHVGQQLGGPPDRGVGDRGHGHRAMPGELQRRGERGPHPPGADDAYGEPRGALPGI